MHGLMNRWVARMQEQKRRGMLKAAIRCELLEGRRLLSGGFQAGGFGGMGFGGGQTDSSSFPQGGPSTAEMSSFGRGTGSQGQNMSGFQNQGGPVVAAQNPGTTQNSQSTNSFANGRSGDNTPLRPYVGWQHNQTPNNTANPNPGTATTSTSSAADSSSSTDTTVSSTERTNNPSSAPTGFGVMNNRGPSFANFNNGGGGPSFSNSNVGGPGFARAGGGGTGFANFNNDVQGLLGGPDFGGGNGGAPYSNPFDLSSSDLSDVKAAIDALRTELKNDLASDAKPSYASIGTLMDDLDAIRSGTLTGIDATSKVQADEAAILTELGLTADQITAIQSDEAALVTAIDAAISASSSSDTSSADPQNPLQDMADVPLLSFLTQLRQNQPTKATGSADSSSSSSSPSA